jgi:hypothetical protein
VDGHSELQVRLAVSGLLIASSALTAPYFLSEWIIAQRFVGELSTENPRARPRRCQPHRARPPILPIPPNASDDQPKAVGHQSSTLVDRLGYLRMTIPCFGSRDCCVAIPSRPARGRVTALSSLAANKLINRSVQQAVRVFAAVALGTAR